MAKTVILEWDSQELRLALMQGETIEDAWAVPLHETSPEAIKQTLRAEVEKHRLQKSDALLAVSRRDVEIRELKIPPAPPEDHPDMLRMVAPREFTQFDDDAVVDFYEIGREDEMHCMLAGSIIGPTLQQLKSIVTGAGLTPKWFALRPMCAVALLEQEPNKGRLVLDLASEEADIAVHNGEQTLSVRNVRLTQQAPEIALEKDVRRTLAMAASQLGRPVQEIVLFGNEEELRKRTANWDFAPELRYISDFAPANIEHPTRFASLFGLAKLYARNESPAFDFLNPRKRPPEPHKITPPIMAAGAIVLVAVVIAAIIMLRLKSLDNKIADMSRTLAKTRETAEDARQMVNHRDIIQSFMNSRVNWLTEMQRVSKNSLEYEDVTFSKWAGRALDGEEGGGVLALDGSAKLPETIDELEENFRDEGHVVEGRGHTIDPKNEEHPYRFRQLQITIASPEQLETNVNQDSADEADASPSDEETSAVSVEETQP